MSSRTAFENKSGIENGERVNHNNNRRQRRQRQQEIELRHFPIIASHDNNEKQQQQQQPRASTIYDTFTKIKVHPQQQQQQASATSTDHLSPPPPPTTSSPSSSSYETIIRVRNACGSFVNDDRFQMIMIMLICINAITMGIATFDFVTDDQFIDDVFHDVDDLFLIVFTIELCLQMIYHNFNIFSDGWLLFDFGIICSSWAFDSIQVIRSLRILRALRLISHIQVMKDIVVALLSVIPRMIAIGILLNIVMYIFAVMLTHLFKHTYEDGITSHPYFITLGDTMFTLFQMMTLDGWSEICQEVQTFYSWAWIPIISYVIASAFIMVNLIIAVICDSIADLQLERLKKERELAKDGGMNGTMYYDDFKTTTHSTTEQHDDNTTTTVDEIGSSVMNVTSSITIPSSHGHAGISLNKADEMRDMVEKLETDIILLASCQEQTGHMMKYLLEQIQNKDM